MEILTRGRFYCHDKSLFIWYTCNRCEKICQDKQEKRAKAIYHIIGQQNRPLVLTSTFGDLDSIPKMCGKMLQRLKSANCTINGKKFWVFFWLHKSWQFQWFEVKYIPYNELSWMTQFIMCSCLLIPVLRWHCTVQFDTKI